MSAITIRRLELQRGKGFRLGPLDLDVPRGSRTALIGPSGCGKTTLLRCIAGLERPRTGTIHLDEREVEGPSVHVDPSARGIGMVFQDGALWPHLTSLQHLTFAAPGLTRGEALALLDQVGLGAAARRRPGSLSGGEIQRLALVRALAGDPGLLLLDEPLHSVDAPLRDELGLVIRNVAEERGLTLVMVTHDRNEALAVADHLIVLREGRVIETGAAADLLTRPRTAFAASFLARATCLPTTVQGDAIRCAFGEFPRAPEPGATPQLVLLPGDVELDLDGPIAGAPSARVLQVLPAGAAWEVTLELDGRVLRVACADPPAPATDVALRLRVPPRFLPEEEPS